MKCFIYKGNKKDGLYLYLRHEGQFDCVPEALLRQLGTPELALSLDITPDTKLNREDPATVCQNLEQQGFHLQLPQSVESLLARHRSPSLH